ncbi:PSD1 and planctomycete cytochrome C domain-containing protein [Prosthecobacter sp.]|uniref:PSD1 and planctomycete cytochrome C domain-containing protein n=1 Tax=Prosthecobacter sp. TaxID=1965333 RepID=UPI001DE19657|nr:PSD1 and planctomycete cytochrome C domain-containing protein [Prosthecobacter sp.]MCB1277950.1 PSD1 domain-containing protein [Prosthecobacter sp.]
MTHSSVSHFHRFATLLAVAILPAASQGAEAISKENLAFFESKIRPLLAKHCYECHSEKAEKVKGGLLLDSADGIAKGGDSGDVIEPGDPGASLLMKSVRNPDPDEQMPPKNRLAETEIEALETWIRIGAPDPRKGGTTATASTKPNWTLEEGRKHWAFQPVTKPQPPAVKDTAWAKTDADKFVLAKIEAAKLKPAPDADRTTLIRRATYDLTGLPPTVEEMQAFIQDPSSDDDAFATVVDRLLKSPQFGERWGRHWLDVVRYADSVGRTRNVAFPYAWRYRDYVIESFNSDKPFNQFLTEQLAGDLMTASNATQRDAQVLGTGFLALGSMDLNERDSEQFFLDRVDDQLDTMGRAFMGLTTGCARCHDHKFDPISQTDYYAVAGIFGSTETLSGQKNRGGGGKDYFAPSKLVKLGVTETKVTPSVATSDKADRERLEHRLAELRKQKTEFQKKGSSASKKERKELDSQIASVGRKLRELDGSSGSKKKGKKAEEPTVSPDDKLAMGAQEGEVQDLKLRVRGEPDQHGDVVPRGFLQVLEWNKQPSLPKDASGRLELAAWLTDARHPLTARVAVNRIWQHLFGRGIVPTVDNFGATGEAPTHPELLDHLAASFTANGWSMKSMIRSLMLSHAYRISSKEIPANMEVDSSNNLFWRMNLRRLEVESIRDAMLAVSGTLNTEHPSTAPMGLDPKLDIGKAKKGGGSGDSFTAPIRSVYLPVLRSRLPGMFTVFDFAEPSQVIGQRDVTTVPPQALFFLNNEFVVNLARKTSERIAALPLANDEARVQHAYRLLFGRDATSDETKRALDYLAGTIQVSSGSKRGEPVDTWTTFVQALMGSAEFRYVM